MIILEQNAQKILLIESKLFSRIPKIQNAKKVPIFISQKLYKKYLNRKGIHRNIIILKK